jgi:hypothetical protein
VGYLDWGDPQKKKEALTVNLWTIPQVSPQIHIQTPKEGSWSLHNKSWFANQGSILKLLRFCLPLSLIFCDIFFSYNANETARANPTQIVRHSELFLHPGKKKLWKLSYIAYLGLPADARPTFMVKAPLSNTITSFFKAIFNHCRCPAEKYYGWGKAIHPAHHVTPLFSIWEALQRDNPEVSDFEQQFLDSVIFNSYISCEQV